MLPDPDVRERARDTALKLLARREHSRFELIRKLRTRDYPDTVIDEVLDALAAAGLQDDARYAEVFAVNRVDRGKGSMRIRAELAQRGVEESLIDATLAALDTDWPALALRVQTRRFGEAPPRDFEDKARRMRFLSARGFSTEHIRAAMRLLGSD